ncbi:MAG: deoxyhypusine synthase [Cyanobacteria bacterium NC_groundwater_1444_Ag_S-0.65um_54_12]|nr:deoxyhypusine synthase [Cyanobacteria bacterium NC_groundwater_1444_Ag_S-0.65um_54_12]
MTSHERLAGKPVVPAALEPGSTVTDLVEKHFQAYNAARLSEAARLFARHMLAPERDVTIGLTLAGALTPAGLGGTVISLLEAGFVDWIVSTGANLYHDMHHALSFTLHQGDFRVNDVELRKAGIIRIYDVLFSDEVLFKTDTFVRQALDIIRKRGPVSSADLHRHLGDCLQPLPGAKYSILAAAARLDVPIYSPAPGDSSIGMNLARLALEGATLHVDPNLDVNETAALVWGAGQNGAILLGGGSPKNFYLQTQPQLWEVLGLNKGGHDYFIQVTADAPHWGGLSGATPSEAVSWGKINPDELCNTVTVYADVTIALPILASYALGAVPPRKLRRLYLQRARLLEQLRDAFLQTAQMATRDS